MAASWTCSACRTINAPALGRCTECRKRRDGADVENEAPAIASSSAHDLGSERRLVLYLSVDDPTGALAGAFHGAIAAEARTLEARGWRLASLSVYPLRTGSSTGSLLTHGGGNYTTVLGASALYVRASEAASTGAPEGWGQP